MRILVYCSPLERLRNPTGVGRHAAEMIRRLTISQDVAVLASSRQMEAARDLFAGAMPRHLRLPLPDRLSRLLLTRTALIPADAWLRDADWIYAPREHALHGLRARIAVTVHDVAGLEPPIPGLVGSGDRRRERHVRRALDRLARRADVILCVSHFTRQRLLELRVVSDESRLHVVGNGVSDVFFDASSEGSRDLLRKTGVDLGDYILLPGSLTWRKGGDLLIDYAERLASQRRSTTIVVTGRRHDPDLIAMLDERRKSVRDFPLKMTGYVDDATLASLMRNALCVVLPSRYEGFGIPVIEAMAAGAPVVVCKGSALEESGGDVAISIPRNDLESLDRAVGECLGADRSDRIARGRERARGFTWARCHDRLVQALQNPASPA